ncbi:hypothetical protein [Streptacidiphilus fuscans]|uniref:Uncharacterized protein n=1 Tax=Streptacidiphilus fuscans TaxID=2789292 RepID=A0A931BA11_9ACTN|nr:hypothetical protein [Streptacidiphilus fuscans]MBF9071397.1 hypothetical protein [Streptacidiphilus fuscans]
MSYSGERSGSVDLWAARALGVALACAASDPLSLVRSGLPSTDGSFGELAGRVVALAALVLLCWFGAPPVVARPVSGDARWHSRLARHRNTAVAVGFVLVAAIGSPPVWLMACDAGLLLAYLVFVDAVAGGPPGAAQLRDGSLLFCAVAAQALVLAGATVSVAATGAWARVVAALLVLLVGAATALALLRGRARGGPGGPGGPDAGGPAPGGSS